VARDDCDDHHARNAMRRETLRGLNRTRAPRPCSTAHIRKTSLRRRRTKWSCRTTRRCDSRVHHTTPEPRRSRLSEIHPWRALPAMIVALGAAKTICAAARDSRPTSLADTPAAVHGHLPGLVVPRETRGRLHKMAWSSGQAHSVASMVGAWLGNEEDREVAARSDDWFGLGHADYRVCFEFLLSSHADVPLDQYS
jgi:hypothetical protein